MLTPIREYENRIVGTTEEDNPEFEEAIALLVREHAATVGASAGMEAESTDQDERNQRQELTIEAYARSRGIWTDNTCSTLSSKYGEPIARGAESIVYAKDGHTVIKAKNTRQYHDLQEAMWAIKLHNQLSPEVRLTIHGFGRNSDGDFCLIISQPFVEISRCLTQEEISAFVSEVYPEFAPDSDIPLPGRFSNGSIYLNDLHPANVLCDTHGDIVVIDSIVRLSGYSEILCHIEDNSTTS